MKKNTEQYSDPHLNTNIISIHMTTSVLHQKQISIGPKSILNLHLHQGKQRYGEKNIVFVGQ